MLKSAILSMSLALVLASSAASIARAGDDVKEGTKQEVRVPASTKEVVQTSDDEKATSDDSHDHGMTTRERRF